MLCFIFEVSKDRDSIDSIDSRGSCSSPELVDLGKSSYRVLILGAAKVNCFWLPDFGTNSVVFRLARLPSYHSSFMTASASTTKARWMRCTMGNSRLVKWSHSMSFNSCRWATPRSAWISRTLVEAMCRTSQQWSSAHWLLQMLFSLSTALPASTASTISLDWGTWCSRRGERGCQWWWLATRPTWRGRSRGKRLRPRCCATGRTDTWSAVPKTTSTCPLSSRPFLSRPSFLSIPPNRWSIDDSPCRRFQCSRGCRAGRGAQRAHPPPRRWPSAEPQWPPMGGATPARLSS